MDKPSTKPARITRSISAVGWAYVRSSSTGAVAPGPWHVEFDVPKLGQQMPAVVTVAAVRNVVAFELLQIDLDCGGHLLLDDLFKGLPAERAITFRPL